MGEGQRDGRESIGLGGSLPERAGGSAVESAAACGGVGRADETELQELLIGLATLL